MLSKKYFALEQSGKVADVYIFGDITSWEWLESDVSSYTLAMQLKALDADVINVHINSYGGEVAEGLAIYNVLRDHKAKVVTRCDGFACSAASVVFMAGEERIMNSTSLLMIHNAWTAAIGDAAELRKQADDLEKISDTAGNAYRDAGLELTEEELAALLAAETWITPAEALEWGFATSVTKQQQGEGKAAASAMRPLFKLIAGARSQPPAQEAEQPPGPTEEDSNPKGGAPDRRRALMQAMISVTAKKGG